MNKLTSQNILTVVESRAVAFDNSTASPDKRLARASLISMPRTESF